MKKFLVIALVLALAVGSCFALTACNKNDAEYVAIDASDLLTEDFGIAITKGNTTLKNAVNAVIDAWVENGKMEQYLDYYEALDEFDKSGEGEAPTAPEGLALSWTFGSAGTIKVYTESGFAPFEFIYGGKVIGVDIAIMSQVAQDLGMNLDIQDVAFDTIATFVSSASGNAVGAAGLSITDERKESVDFSSIYFSSTLVIVSNKDKSYSSVAGLANLKVGVQEGTSGDHIISAAITAGGHSYENEDDVTVTVKAAGASVTRYKQYALALADLKAGRIDAILMDKLPALSLLKLQG